MFHLFTFTFLYFCATTLNLSKQPAFQAMQLNNQFACVFLVDFQCESTNLSCWKKNFHKSNFEPIFRILMINESVFWGSIFVELFVASEDESSTNIYILGKNSFREFFAVMWSFLCILQLSLLQVKGWGAKLRNYINHSCVIRTRTKMQLCNGRENWCIIKFLFTYE